MKTPLLKPGFEFIFSLSLIAILALPPMLMAQNQKDEDIRIENGDTTINGKNIKDLSPQERESALADIKHLSGAATADMNDNSNVLFFKQTDTAGGQNPTTDENLVIQKDSAGNVTAMRMRRKAFARRMEMRLRNHNMPGGAAWMRRGGDTGPMMNFDQRNSQTFNYVTTDNNGISTHESFHITGASNDDLKRMPYIQGPRLDLSDLTIVPVFTSGKTLLMFNLPAKTTAEVKLIDDNAKVLWSEKCTGGSFSKSFTMGLNGIYYLQVKQGKKVAVKKILKEE